MSMNIIPILRASTNKNKCMYYEYSRLNIQHNSFSRFGVRLWNSIPKTPNHFQKTLLKRKKNETAPVFDKRIKPTKSLKSSFLLFLDKLIIQNYFLFSITLII